MFSLKKWLDRWGQYLQDNEESKKLKRLTFYQRHDWVCYYPSFSDRPPLLDHWFRARWYLPQVKPWLNKVFWGTNEKSTIPSPQDRPSYICEPPTADNHFELSSGRFGLLWRVLRSRHIVIWQQQGISDKLLFLMRLLGKRLHFVDINNETGREYATYCELLWWVIAPPMRRAVNHKSRQRFNELHQRLKQLGYDRSYVFGNGPSLETSFDYDFSNGYRIMCNSVVNNLPLLDHVQPHFVVAGDPVNHFGCSTYAAKYRQMVFKALDERPEMFLVIPDFQGYVMMANHPKYENRIIIIPMKAKVVNFNLIREYRIPVFWSVLNALMIPLACTLADDVYTLGCDGMSRTRDNEDFWAHAKGVIDQKIDAAHRCHPTFDLHRKSHPEYVRVQLDLAQNIIRAENEHNKRFYAINHSHMALLDARHVDMPKLEQTTNP